MFELSSEARALLRDGQGVLRPSANDRARIAGALSLRLGATAMLVATPAVAAAKKSLISLKLSLAATSAGIVVAGAGYLWSQPVTTDVGSSPTVTQARAADVAPAPVVSEPDAALPQNEPESAAPVAPAPAPPAHAAPADRLGEEVNILSRAMTVLRAGKPAEALRLLEQHRRQFPTGRLTEERRAARVQALCALGRRGDAEAELTRLERNAPRSPHVARAKRACGLD